MTDIRDALSDFGYKIEAELEYWQELLAQEIVEVLEGGLDVDGRLDKRDIDLLLDKVYDLVSNKDFPTTF